MKSSRKRILLSKNCISDYLILTKLLQDGFLHCPPVNNLEILECTAGAYSILYNQDTFRKRRPQSLACYVQAVSFLRAIHNASTNPEPTSKPVVR